MHVVESVRTVRSRSQAIFRDLSQSLLWRQRDCPRGRSESELVLQYRETSHLRDFGVRRTRQELLARGPGLAMLSPAISNDQQPFQRIEPEPGQTSRNVFPARLPLAIDTEAAGARQLGACGSVESYIWTRQRLPALIAMGRRCIAGARRASDRPRIESAFRELNWQNPPSFRTFLREAAAAKDDGPSISTTTCAG